MGNKVYGNLLIALEKTGIKKRDVAKLIDVSNNTLTTRFNGNSEWTLREINLIKTELCSKGYNTTVDDLFKQI